MKKLNHISHCVAAGCFLALVPLAARAQHAACAVSGIQRRVIRKTELSSLEAAQSKPMTSGNAIVLAHPTNSILVTTGTGDDNESYRIDGIRNPTIVIHAGASVKILFVNIDGDLPHDLRVGDVKPPDTAGTYGSVRLERARDDSYSAEEFQLQMPMPGSYNYFCSVGSHAKNGMVGRIVVLKPNASMSEMLRAK